MKKYKKYLIPILILLLLIITSYLFVSCLSKGWYDDGISYCCPDCQNIGLNEAIGICEKCGCEIHSSDLKYCYDCAKEMERCQRCGKNKH